MSGITWKADDDEWAFGSGPQVAGPAEALIMLASGRPAALAEASGDGLSVIRQRLAA